MMVQFKILNFLKNGSPCFITHKHKKKNYTTHKTHTLFCSVTLLK